MKNRKKAERKKDREKGEREGWLWPKEREDRKKAERKKDRREREGRQWPKTERIERRQRERHRERGRERKKERESERGNERGKERESDIESNKSLKLCFSCIIWRLLSMNRLQGHRGSAFAEAATASTAFEVTFLGRDPPKWVRGWTKSFCCHSNRN